jgi:hypothetical protein
MKVSRFEQRNFYLSVDTRLQTDWQTDRHDFHVTRFFLSFWREHTSKKHLQASHVLIHLRTYSLVLSSQRAGIGIRYGWMTEESSSSPGRVKHFLFPTSSRPALGSTQPPLQWIPGALPPGFKRSGCEVHTKCGSIHPLPHTPQWRSA